MKVFLIKKPDIEPSEILKYNKIYAAEGLIQESGKVILALFDENNMFCIKSFVTYNSMDDVIKNHCNNEASLIQICF